MDSVESGRQLTLNVAPRRRERNGARFTHPARRVARIPDVDGAMMVQELERDCVCRVGHVARAAKAWTRAPSSDGILPNVLVSEP